MQQLTLQRVNSIAKANHYIVNTKRRAIALLSFYIIKNLDYLPLIQYYVYKLFQGNPTRGHNMLLPDPINNPGAPGFSSSELQSVQPFLQDSMPNTKVITVTSGEQYWKLSLGYSDLLVSEYNILNQQIDKTIQLGETLEVWLPQYEDYTFKLSNYQQISTTINSVTLSGTGRQSTPKVGHMIQFQNHKKVYRINGYTLSGSNIIISFYPSLRVPVPAATLVKFTGIRFNMEFMDRSAPISGAMYNSDGFYGEGITLELRESI